MDKRRIRALDFNYEDIKQAIEDGDKETASSMLSQYLTENPEDPAALYALAQLFVRSSNHAYALPVLEKSLRIEPIAHATWHLYGMVLDHMNDHKEAVRAFTRAYRVGGGPDMLADISMAYVNAREIDKAEDFAKACLKDDPGNQQALHNLGWVQLFRKDTAGWLNYVRGQGGQQRQLRYYGCPDWEGQPVDELIIYGEQGMGDEICFSSAIPDAMKDAKRVILDVSPRLVRLYERSFPDVEIHGTRFNNEMDWGYMPKADASIIMSSLFKFYRTEGYPGTPFLTPNKSQVESIRKRHRKGKKLVGLAWTGGMPATKRKERSLHIDQLKPIYENKDYTFISLEYVPKDLKDYPIRYTEEAWSDDMDDVASLVAACDLVISVPTTVVHLAGALGVPCWTMVHERPTVFYGLEGGLDIWNSVDVFRKDGREWSEVIQDVANRLNSEGVTG